MSSAEVPKFIKKLFRETSDENNPHIKWNAAGDKVCIPNKDNFIRHAISKISSTKDYSGFVRQMNMYGFYKIKSPDSEDYDEYYNQYFLRDDPEQMALITRDKLKKNDDSVSNTSKMLNNLQFLSNANYKLTREVESLKERLERQECTLQGLVEILGNVFRTGAQKVKSDFETVPFNEYSSFKLDSSKPNLINDRINGRVNDRIHSNDGISTFKTIHDILDLKKNQFKMKNSPKKLVGNNSVVNNFSKSSFDKRNFNKSSLEDNLISNQNIIKSSDRKKSARKSDRNPLFNSSEIPEFDESGEETKKLEGPPNVYDLYF